MATASTSSAFEHAQRARGVCRVGPHWIGDAPGNAAKCREVHDRVGTGKGLVYRTMIQDGSLDQSPDRVQVLAVSRREVVQNYDLVACAESGGAEVRSDEAGSAGYRYAHGVTCPWLGL